MKRELLELKQKLMQRFLDGAIDQATYDRMLSEIGVDGRAHRPDREPRHLERLQTEGDADDGDAPEKSEQKPRDRRFKTGEDEPEDVADCFHFLPFSM